MFVYCYKGKLRSWILLLSIYFLFTLFDSGQVGTHFVHGFLIFVLFYRVMHNSSSSCLIENNE
ncbi:hypothetical protein DM01DRAFT_1085974 [Hesseltinella vesiculosa]|uniref:Uncharacterized protein n=1 Tax=Hesseltinella vesiculosa TaxID=101127 RepID=A0A1X2GD77_9FUNG|nr:hypothetical protein DM01DRAFT_1085974 [Hesseltinella vesiculosa]